MHGAISLDVLRLIGFPLFPMRPVYVLIYVTLLQKKQQQHRNLSIVSSISTSKLKLFIDDNLQSKRYEKGRREKGKTHSLL